LGWGKQNPKGTQKKKTYHLGKNHGDKNLFWPQVWGFFVVWGFLFLFVFFYTFPTNLKGEEDLWVKKNPRGEKKKTTAPPKRKKKKKGERIPPPRDRKAHLLWLFFENVVKKKPPRGKRGCLRAEPTKPVWSGPTSPNGPIKIAFF